eukprot:2964333-Alexandrium_andersonii.AAC.1
MRTPQVLSAAGSRGADRVDATRHQRAPAVVARPGSCQLVGAVPLPTTSAAATGGPLTAPAKAG